MPAVIREDQIGETIAVLDQYRQAIAPLNIAHPDLADEELILIRQHRIARAKLALENIGIQISQPLASLQALASPTPRDIADSADAAIAAHQYIPDIP